MGTEIQDFAELLRGLKERSGLSYGALARKLHMSTSTVHRYCNGDAVPHDYAPVERFARVCRASSDELMALHRKWILADEAKRRGARKPEAGGGATAPGPDAPETAVPAPAAPDQAEAEAESRTKAETGTEPAAGPVAEAVTGSVAEPAGGPVPEAVTEDVTPDGARPDGVPPPRRRTTRRLRVLLTAVAVVALTVPAALAVRALGDDGPADGDRRTDAAPSHVQAVPSGRVSGHGTMKPSRSASASASASAGASASAPAGSGPTAKPSPSPKGPVSGSAVPVSATISSYNWESPCGQYYLLHQDPDDVPEPPDPQDSRSWARARGGVDGGDLKLEVTVQGLSSAAVVLKELNVRVVGRNPALDWSAYSMGEGCGSGITPQSFAIDLDDGLPLAKPVAGKQGDTVIPATSFPYQVSSTDVEVFRIDAHVEEHDVAWYLELQWTSAGQSGVLRIDDGGRPFRTSSLSARPSYSYQWDTAQWKLREQ
ncbi:helix-turn-helix domain-containing protein [Streptomyces sp. NPDC014623]|uniref:helix-turn-helix domain-containing protein n=1 Tax=Streptomyces sp. NPDC014623 TaxID=3364875 RepID=UPI0036F54B3F